MPPAKGNNHLLPGVLFIGSVIMGMFALVQARELKQKKPNLSNLLKTAAKKTLEELVEEINAKYPPEQDYEMKKTPT